MNYLSAAEIAAKGASPSEVSAITVRRGAFLTGKTWNIPEDAVKPIRKNSKQKAPETLLEILREQESSE